jgi:ribosomal protein L11 methyltransferase
MATAFGEADDGPIWQSWHAAWVERTIGAMLVKLVVRTPRKLQEIVSEVLFQAGAGGIEEQDNGRKLLVYAASREDAEGIAERALGLLRDVAPGPNGIALNVEVDESSEWDTEWTQHLRQIALTPRLVIQPEWDDTPAPEGTRRIVYDPQLSFGDGAHATTRLASVALERICSTTPGLRVLDFGSGTGALSFVALLSGASAAYGVDIDPISVSAAQLNAALNGLGERASFALPSARCTAYFDLVVANLEAPTLFGLAADIALRAAGAQRLVLTGFLANRAAEISSAFPAFTVAQTDEADDWALLELVPAP